MSTIIAVYLGLGALAAAGVYVALALGIKHREDDPGLQNVMSDLERQLNALPGGVLTALLVVLLTWPAVLVVFLKPVRR